MSARWKRENPDTLIMMHAHNRWSNFNSKLIEATEALGIPYAIRCSDNHYDGSPDKEYLVPHGCKRRIMDLAIEMRQMELDERSDY